jgi:hypothetical protein
MKEGYVREKTRRIDMEEGWMEMKEELIIKSISESYGMRCDSLSMDHKHLQLVGLLLLRAERAMKKVGFTNQLVTCFAKNGRDISISRHKDS